MAVIAVCGSLFPENAERSLKKKPWSRYIGSVITAQGTVRSYEEKDGYAVLLLRDAIFEAGQHGEPVLSRLHTVRVIAETPPEACRVGQTVLVRGMLRASEGPSNPGQFDEALYDRIRHISCRMSRAQILWRSTRWSIPGEMIASFRRALYRRLCEVYPEDTREVLGAVLLGRKELLSEETSSKYESAGVSHMLVISSLHLSILGTLVFRSLRKGGSSLRGAIFAGGGVLLFFAALTGGSLSSFRALIVYGFNMFAKWTGRTCDRKNAAAFACLVILLSDPYYLFYSSFQLSFAAAVLCILAENKGRTASCVILQFGMMPLIAWHFFEIPLLGVPANLLMLPLLPLLLVTGAAGLLFGGAAAYPAVICVRLYDRILSLIRDVPDSAVLFGKWKIPLRAVLITGRPHAVRMLLYYALFGLFLLALHHFRNRARKLWTYLLLPLMLLILGIRIPGGMRITFLDVGQGDGICVESPHGTAMLVDGGSSTVQRAGTYRILPFIKYRGIRRLDVIAVTHADTDHMNGVLEILEKMAEGTTSLRAEYLLLPDVTEPLSKEEEYLALEEAARRAGVSVLKVRRGDSFSFDGVEVRILGPENRQEQEETDANAQCIVMEVRYGRFDALLTGDTEGEGEKELLRQMEEENRTYEILKVAHHGSRYSTPQELLTLIRPEVSVISAGRNNLYGHPHAETMGRLRKCGTTVYITAASGAVTVTTDGSRYSVKPFLKPVQNSFRT